MVKLELSEDRKTAVLKLPQSHLLLSFLVYHSAGEKIWVVSLVDSMEGVDCLRRIFIKLPRVVTLLSDGEVIMTSEQTSAQKCSLHSVQIPLTGGALLIDYSFVDEKEVDLSGVFITGKELVRAELC